MGKPKTIKPTDGPWFYRPRQDDDWGFVRAADGELVAVSRASRSDSLEEKAEHRRNGTDPSLSGPAARAARSDFRCKGCKDYSGDIFARADVIGGAVIMALALAATVYNMPYVAGWTATAPARAAAVATGAPVEMHYAPQEDLEAVDVALIDGAGETIDMAAYVLTDAAVIEALDTAAARGVKVRLYRWPSEHDPSPSAAEALARLAAEPGFEQRFRRAQT